MFLKVKKILLWPKNPNKQLRIIDFDLSKVNVITGYSQKGKSAIIPIIDYCLGSSKCMIPVGIIRQKTEWFGILLQTEHTQILLARQEPGVHRHSTSLMYMKEAKIISDFERPHVNCNIDSVKNRLNELAVLSSLGFEGELDQHQGFKSRPSFRDFVSFVFQPQHIVANPFTLFYRADTYEHREKLRTIFPLALGAIDNEYLALKEELNQLEELLNKKKKELETSRLTAEAWKSRLKEFYSQGRELGLLPDSGEPDDSWDTEKYLNYLKRIPQNIENMGLPKVDEGGTERVIREIIGLKKEEEEISHDLGVRRLKLIKIEQVRSSLEIYKKEVESQNSRLESIGWFADKIKSFNICPFCGSENDSALTEISRLLSLADNVKNASDAVVNANSVLDREVAQIKKQLRHLEERLNIVRKHRLALEGESKEINEKRHVLSEVYRYIGRLEQSLDNIRIISDGSELTQEISNLEKKVKDIREKLDPSFVERRIDNALLKISLIMLHYTEILGVEKPNSMARLDVKNLTLKILDDDGKFDYLWEIGSGANWMGYHISIMAALHEYFVSLANNHVPQILIIDQPSQVYFPESFPSEMTNTREVSDDIVRTRWIFKALSDLLKRTNNKVQIIVSEHAEDITWEGLDNIHVVERWRYDNALIPDAWLDD